MKKSLVATAVMVMLLAFGSGAQASLINTPVSANAYVTLNGFQWAWASPVAADGSFGQGGIDLSVQGALGWRLPTAAELLLAPTALQFMFAGANVPLGGSDPVSGAEFQFTNANLTGAAACAAPWFNNTYFHCDWDNGRGQNQNNPGDPVDWWGSPGSLSYFDSLVVRQVPEPATMAVFGLGLAAALRRRVANRVR